MASADSKANAYWGVAHRITFPLLDADGDLVTGATTPDSEISKDGGTFADCTNEMTEIATSSGVYYLDLTATEMEADQIVIIAKSASAGMKTTVIVLYPLQGIRTRKAQAGAAGSITLDASANATDDFYNDCLVQIVGGTGVGQARLVSDYVGSTKVASVVPNWVTTPDSTSIFHVNPSGRVDIGQWVDVAPSALISGRVDASVGAMQTGVITAAAHAAGAIDAAAIASDAITAAKIADGAIDAATLATGTITAAKFAAGAIDAAAIADNAIDAGAIATGAITAAKFAAGAIDAAAIATNAIDADALAADVTTELQSGLATAAALATVQADTDNIQTRLPAALVGGRMDCDVAVIQANAVSASALAADAVSEIQSGLALSTQVDALEAAAIAIEADTQDIQARLPAALVGGRIDASVGSMAADVITAAALAADAANEVADALLKRDVDQVEASTAIHSLASAVLKLVSRFKATTGQTFRTNGTTVHMTQTPVNDPVTAISELGVGA